MPTVVEGELSEPEELSEAEAPEPEPTPTPAPRTPGRFTLRYDPGSTLNPITAMNRDNILLSSLLYESLFTLDENLVAVPLLCEDWSTEDNMTFTFEVMPGIMMSDGSYMTADDVAYSLRQAMSTGRFANRFTTVSSVASDGELTVTIVLNAPNSRFIRLLDIPIIRYGTINNPIPPGSGPYFYVGEEAMRLERFPYHRDFARLPLPAIHLRSCLDTELTALFDDGGLSIIWDDPTDAFDVRLNRLRDPHYYNTTSLHFLGFNSNHVALRDPDVRRAIGCSIERQYIVDNIMPGNSLASPLAISPAFDLYDAAWERRNLDPLREMAELLIRAGIDDFDNDGFFELADRRVDVDVDVDLDDEDYVGFIRFTIDFIVNIENSNKVQAAHRIADTLRRIGFNITVRELQWDNFISALEAGNFDMYYGETLLSADFDLSPLLLPGPLNYGRTAHSDYRPFIEEFLAAQGDDDVRLAAGRLCHEIYLNAPFVPILYERHVIYSSMGAISGAAPSQSGVFRNFTDWTIDLYMLN